MLHRFMAVAVSSDFRKSLNIGAVEQRPVSASAALRAGVKSQYAASPGSGLVGKNCPRSVLLGLLGTGGSQVFL